MIKVHTGIYIKYSVISATEHLRQYKPTSSILATVKNIPLFHKCIFCYCTVQFLTLGLINQNMGVKYENKKD
jgi:hypothetical protein